VRARARVRVGFVWERKPGKSGLCLSILDVKRGTDIFQANAYTNKLTIDIGFRFTTFIGADLRYDAPSYGTIEASTHYLQRFEQLFISNFTWICELSSGTGTLDRLVTTNGTHKSKQSPRKAFFC
jgi:hypothetical protein